MLGGANAASGLEADREAGLQRVFADGADHDEADGERGVDGLFAGGRFDEVGAGHHGDDGGAGDVAKREQIAGAENDFEVRGAAGVFEGGDFVVQGLPFGAEDVGASDDDVDFVGAGFDGAANFRDAFGERREAGGEAGADGGNANAGAFESATGGFDEKMVDADGGDFDVEGCDAEFRDEFMLQRMTAFGAEAADAFVGVVAGKSGEVHDGDGAEKPGGLVVLFYGAARAEGSGAAFDGGGVDADGFDPVEIEGDAAVRLEREIAEVG